MYRSAKAVDEEAELIQVRDLSIQHKLLLEQQQAIFGPAHVPPHVPMGIVYYEQQIEHLNKRIANVRRRKKRQERLRQLAEASSHVTQVLVGGGAQRHSQKARKRRKSFSIAAVGLGVVIAIGALIIGGFRSVSGQIQTVDLKSNMSPAPLIGNFEAAATPPMLPTLDPIQATSFALPNSVPQDPEKRFIGNTGGIGVRFRVEPYQEAPSYQDLPDGVLVYLLDNSIDLTGTIWWKVALASGEVGYVKERYLLWP